MHMLAIVYHIAQVPVQMHVTFLLHTESMSHNGAGGVTQSDAAARPFVGQKVSLVPLNWVTPTVMVLGFTSTWTTDCPSGSGGDRSFCSNAVEGCLCVRYGSGQHKLFVLASAPELSSARMSAVIKWSIS